MKRNLVVGILVCFVGIASATSPAWGVYHDPWLNWDFWNFNNTPANNFEIVVESGTFNPDPLKGEVLIGAPFPNFSVSHPDYNGDGNLDTVLSWSGANVNPPLNPGAPLPNEVAHIGAYMKGSGKILAAYWTDPNGMLGLPLAISYELTEIRPMDSPAEVHMQLQMPQSFFDSHPSEEAGWTNIRTFMNIPASELGLADLNREDLDAAALQVLHDAGYEVTPIDGKTGLPITGPVMVNVESFFDVFLGVIDDAHQGPQYESLLVATALDPGVPIGMFWNLNPQSPEPATLALLGLGAVATLVRRRRSR
jgi:hypothetical protein